MRIHVWKVTVTVTISQENKSYPPNPVIKSPPLKLLLDCSVSVKNCNSFAQEICVFGMSVSVRLLYNFLKTFTGSIHLIALILS